MDSMINQLKRLEETGRAYKKTEELLFHAAQELTNTLADSYSELDIDFNGNRYYVYKQILYQNGISICKNRKNILLFIDDIKAGLLEKIKC